MIAHWSQTVKYEENEILWVLIRATARTTSKLSVIGFDWLYWLIVDCKILIFCVCLIANTGDGHGVQSVGFGGNIMDIIEKKESMDEKLSFFVFLCLFLFVYVKFNWYWYD